MIVHQQTTCFPVDIHAIIDLHLLRIHPKLFPIPMPLNLTLQEKSRDVVNLQENQSHVTQP